jgi:hypothetical protein
LKAAGLQSQSTKSYFVAEAGAERLLWELRKNSWVRESPSTENEVFSDTLDSGASFKVYYTNFSPLTFTAIGEFNKTKRSVELKM